MDNIKKKYLHWEWRTIIVLSIGYALFYFVRKNLSVAIPAMEQELGISKVQLGVFLTVNSIRCFSNCILCFTAFVKLNFAPRCINHRAEETENEQSDYHYKPNDTELGTEKSANYHSCG